MGADGWMNCSLGDLAANTKNALVGGPFGSNLVSADYVPEGIPVIRGQNMTFGRWVEGDFVFVTPEKADTLSANIARPGDLVFTQRGTLGQVAIVPKGRFDRYVISQSQMKVTIDERKADALFLYYYFTNQEALEYFRLNTIQTGVPHTNLGILRTTPVRLPPLAEQRAIAHILGTLDDKIELSRRMNETLEAMARAIFQSWLVDFDPVRAKGEGRQPPGIDAATAALFPDSFEDSPLAKIPKGWRVGTLGDLADSPRRGINPSEIAPGTPYIGLEHMPRKCIALSEWGYSDGVASNKFRFAEGNILFGKLRPYFHKVGIAAIDGVCSTDILVIVPKLSHWLGVVAAYVSTDEFIQYADGVSTGTKMPRTNWNDMARYEIVVPDDKVARAFTEKIKPMIDTIRSNIHHSRTLGAIRDALLPKLLSGEIRVRDAEKLAERAV